MHNTHVIWAFLVFFLVFKGALIPILEVFDTKTPESEKYGSRGYGIFYLGYAIAFVVMQIYWK